MKKNNILTKEAARRAGEHVIIQKPDPLRDMYFVKIPHDSEIGPFCLWCSEGFSNVRISDRTDVEKGWEWRCIGCGKTID